MRNAVSCFLLIATLCLRAEKGAHESDFRNASWGMTIEEVWELEKTPTSERKDEHWLILNDTIAGVNMDVTYRFDSNGRLYEGTYLKEYDGKTMKPKISFDKVEALLDKKHGPAKVANKSTTKKTDTISTRETDSSTISNALFISDDFSNHLIVYQTKEFEPDLDFSEERKTLDKL
ncbi:hypothetical protein [Rubellicoccus peritrichatus]|uniref:Uncharacterized protein n=1 Tax=Rubellicoccus peritrichatus TaxID=3080537 RepID=A0AAQ3QWX2_9BACT|nr:hypothetical protein [Puniceicoccus sp. CR14]WOO43128.1 hypothetical protein RZN69_08485 [Puniceicoccus sp. CR14]